MNYIPLYALLWMFVFYTPSKVGNKTQLPTDTIEAQTKELITSQGQTHRFVPLGKIERVTFGLLQTKVFFATMEKLLPISQVI